MGYLKEEVVTTNLGMILYHLVFGEFAQMWFSAQTVHIALLERGCDVYSEQRIDQMLKEWSCCGKLDRRLSQYHVSERERAFGQVVRMLETL